MNSSWGVATVFVTNGWTHLAIHGRSLSLLVAVVVVVFDQTESN